jgi:hypothetical protein
MACRSAAELMVAMARSMAAYPFQDQSSEGPKTMNEDLIERITALGRGIAGSGECVSFNTSEIEEGRALYLGLQKIATMAEPLPKWATDFQPKA